MLGPTQNALSPYVLRLVLGTRQLDEVEQGMCGCVGNEQFLQILRTFATEGLAAKHQHFELESNINRKVV